MPNSKFTLRLREECKKLGIKGCTHIKNSEIIEKLREKGFNVEVIYKKDSKQKATGDRKDSKQKAKPDRNNLIDKRLDSIEKRLEVIEKMLGIEYKPEEPKPEEPEEPKPEEPKPEEPEDYKPKRHKPFPPEEEPKPDMQKFRRVYKTFEEEAKNGIKATNDTKENTKQGELGGYNLIKKKGNELTHIIPTKKLRKEINKDIKNAKQIEIEELELELEIEKLNEKRKNLVKEHDSETDPAKKKILRMDMFGITDEKREIKKKIDGIKQEIIDMDKPKEKPKTFGDIKKELAEDRKELRRLNKIIEAGQDDMFAKTDYGVIGTPEYSRLLELQEKDKLKTIEEKMTEILKNDENSEIAELNRLRWWYSQRKDRFNKNVYGRKKALKKQIRQTENFLENSRDKNYINRRYYDKTDLHGKTFSG